jgi:hypothetical protein
MAGYIYNLVQSTASGKVELLNCSTKKYVITDFIKREFLEIGWSLDSLTIIRAQDGRPATVTHIDPYDFMQIDLGEE